MSWTGDGLLNAHTVARNDTGQFTNSAAYVYANQTHRLSQEVLDLSASTRWTNTFTYDAGVTAGPGVLSSTRLGELVRTE